MVREEGNAHFLGEVRVREGSGPAAGFVALAGGDGEARRWASMSKSTVEGRRDSGGVDVVVVVVVVVVLCGEGEEVGEDGEAEEAVGVEDLPNHFFTPVLMERDMDDGGLASELDIFDDQGGGADLGAAQKIEMEREGMGLTLFGKSRLEMLLDGSLDGRRRGSGLLCLVCTCPPGG
jgi:hypothetical protein